MSVVWCPDDIREISKRFTESRGYDFSSDGGPSDLVGKYSSKA